MTHSYTRQFTAMIAPAGAVDPRYELVKPTWHVVYEKDGKVVFASVTPKPHESVKSILAKQGVNIDDALIQHMW